MAFELVIAYPYRSHWQPDLMARDGLIELGARTIFGGRFHSSVLGGQQSSVPAAVEALGPLAAEQALNTARSDRSRLNRRSIRRARTARG